MIELYVAVGMMVVMAAVTGLSLWRFEKKRADKAVADNTQLHTQLAELRTQLAELKVERTSLLESLNTCETRLKESQQEAAQLQQRLTAQAEQLGRFEATKIQLQEMQQQVETQSTQVTKLSAENADLKARLEEQATQHAQQLELLQAAKKELTEAFENLSNRLYEQKQQQFSQQSRQQLEALLKPYQQQLSQFRSRMDELHTQQQQGLGVLQGELKQLKELNETLSKEAEALTRALRSESKTQGNWGEMVLEKLLKSAGLREGEEFVREKVLQDRSRPDVIINLPDGKHIVVDAKVSLTAYLAALGAEDEAQRKAEIKALVTSMTRHIDTLGEKRYHLSGELDAPEFTLMFVPLEGAYLMALEAKPDLLEYAYEKGVALVTPPTLLVTLKTVGHLWKLAHQDKRMLELMEEAGKLYDKFADFIKDFQEIGQRIDQAHKAWSRAENKLSTGTGNLVRRVDKLGALSAKVKKTLPENLRERALIEHEKAIEK